MYSVGFEAVLMTAMQADTMPKKRATAMQAMVAMYNSLIRKVRSWKRMSRRSMWKCRSPKPWFSFLLPSNNPKLMKPLDLLLLSRVAVDTTQKLVPRPPNSN